MTSELYYEEAGAGVPILLIHPAGSTASTWGAASEELAQIGRVIAYDRRGYARSGGEPVHSMAPHTLDAADLLEDLQAAPAVVVGTSAGAAIAVDLAVRRPDVVRAVVAHEFPWRTIYHLPTRSQLVTFAKLATRMLSRRDVAAVEVLLRAAYTYGDGGSAWDAFPEEWRQAARNNARSTLADFRNSIGNHPTATELSTIAVPVVCSYGARSPEWMSRLTHLLGAAIPNATVHRLEGSAHAAPFDATAGFVGLVARTIESSTDAARTR